MNTLVAKNGIIGSIKYKIMIGKILSPVLLEIEQFIWEHETNNT